MTYDHKKIEAKWRNAWVKDKKLYATDEKSKKPKRYVLDMFPYPSGEGLHVGHVEGSTGTDIYSRYLRMNGYSVLHPIGWDAFGLPAENFAIKHKVHPAKVVKKNIANFRKQMQSIGFSYDWSREVDTTDPQYYKWTQWIFLKLFEKGLAYEADLPINFCPSCKTGLANEEVIDGACERCGTLVIQKKLRQWVLKITAYADRLLADLEGLDWPEKIIAMQRNWIGRSEGAEIDFLLTTKEKQKFVILHGYKSAADRPRWQWIKKELEKAGHEVLVPQLPNSDEPSEEDQVAAAIACTIYDENTVLVGHSLGAVVAMKTLQKLNRNISGLILIAAAIDPNFQGAEKRPFWKTFSWDINYKKLQALTKFRFVLSDLGEPNVRVQYLKTLSSNLDARLVETYAQKEHFTGDVEPEILSLLSPTIRVFTTRPDTLFGATFVAIAPELAQKWADVGWHASGDVKRFITNEMARKAKADYAPDTEKRGVFSGVMAVNPANGKEIPVWVVNYVLADVGTGAIMAVPSHDQRDFEFAMKFSIPIIVVIEPTGTVGEMLLTKAYEGMGKLIHSEKFDGMESEKAKKAITEFAGGKTTVKYKLRDWNFSRQRYWGEPIPIIRCPHCGNVPLSEKDLPLKLPNVKNYEPSGTGESPLAAIDKWVNVKCPKCKGPAKRETNTMPQWAGSCWYYLRYIDPKNKKNLVDTKKEKKWMPVDLYVGGAEHAVLHLLYARFWHKVLYDIGAVSTKEPFKKLINQGMILGPNGVKMSKSKGNVINPDDIVAQYGADVLRLYEMFMGPFEEVKAWDTKSITGIRRFLNRIYTLSEKVAGKKAKDVVLEKTMHKTIKKVTEDIAAFRFNTAISAMMIALNDMEKAQSVPYDVYVSFLKLLAPFAPFVTEELWHMLGNKKSIHLEKWPEFDVKLLADETFILVVQVNGKTRDTVEVQKEISEEEAKRIILRLEKVKQATGEAQIKKVIFVKNRLINIVI